MIQLVNKQSENGVNDEKINIKAIDNIDNINHSTLCEKRKYDEVEKETENINNLTLIDGMSIPQNKNKKCKVAITEEKRLKLEKEKVYNILLI